MQMRADLPTADDTSQNHSITCGKCTQLPMLQEPQSTSRNG